MKKIILTMIAISISLYANSQLTITTSGNNNPKFVGKEGKNTYRFKDVKLGFTKTTEENTENTSLKTIYVIFELSPKSGEKYPPQNPNYFSRIYKLSNIPTGYDPKSYYGSVIRVVSKDFLKHCADIYKINPEHYSASFQANYDYTILEKSLTGYLAYTNTGRLWVIDDNFAFNYKDDKYAYNYSPTK